MTITAIGRVRALATLYRQGCDADDRAARDPAAIWPVTERLHQTANNLYAVVTGAVRATINGQTDQVLEHVDVLAVPLWHGHVLRGVQDATLLRVTDEPVTAKFGLLRHG